MNTPQLIASSVARSVAGVAGGGVVPWTPLQLFASSEVGLWADVTDISTLWQVGNGTVPVTAGSDPIGMVADKSGGSRNIIQLTTSRRPLYNIGKYATLDGTDDWLDAGDLDALTYGNGTTDLPFSVSIHANVALGNGSFFSKYATSNFEYTLGFVSGNVTLYLYDQSATAYIGRVAPGFVRSEWAEWTSTYDGTGTAAGIKIYKNGVRVDATNAVFGTYVAMENKASALTVGINNGAFGGPSNMSFSSSVMVNRVLTATEVLDLSTYNAARLA